MSSAEHFIDSNTPPSLLAAGRPLLRLDPLQRRTPSSAAVP